ncbi:hypothetical protein DSM43518_04795 [Mycobacterium marinum]|uniref:hypothetical protein n=1 Tax=Mycobacterium marinum TaxID=1781 RepID=UPI000CD95AF1|nr:hypothetical protein [Mycobacterium marinum]AXN51253.1 hypothetical protein CCUG20998_03857 [Mycobacterium marinum]RFZ02808.1 hypothetical protein DSM43518_04795 [Mycobacterium marinum]RFZ25999.1 hypothetical protein DSM43519_01313 [Mycobacterium marinum]RFZ28878.1 hypothetical protein DSM44344_01145 [Mycobacterium marinum]RFZ39064.1 hypothetical protein NCTC2275_00332 [Mycobacterium marinum]
MIVHRCLAGSACREATTGDAGRLGATTITPNTLCPACDSYFTHAIRQLPRDWAELRNALGERSNTTGTKIRSTPTPAIPISTRKEALMAAIVDMTDRAAAIVSDRLHTGQPATYHGRGIPTHAEHVVRASIAIVEPNIDLLISAPAETMMIWAKPARCDTHTRLIVALEERIASETRPKERATAQNQLTRAHHTAGACDDCNGWGHYGQERTLVERSGLDIALELVELHNQTRAELGKTRLRHRYPMPCPRCGGRVGRDDGHTIITCDRDTCRASWTEREYQFLAGLITRERLDMEILKWLLAEAYTRLDDAQQRLNKLTPEDLALPGAGLVIAEAMNQAIAGHPTPEQRAITTDQKTTQQRQTTEDNWAWRNETPYHPPKRKPRKATRQAGPPIEELVNPEQATNACPGCNLVHRGQCA